VGLAREGHERGADLIVFPELNISSYAVDDLHLQEAFLDAVEEGIADLCKQTADLSPVLAVGAPLRRNGRLYNCALAISRGRILGVVPKSFLPNYREYYEKRWFAMGFGLDGMDIAVAGQLVPFGTDLIFAARISTTSSSTWRFARIIGRRSRPRRWGRCRARLSSATYPPPISPSARRMSANCSAPPNRPAAARRIFMQPRARREHDRPCLGRAGVDLRIRRNACGIEPLRARPGARPRRYRRPAAPARADADGDVQRQCDRRGASREDGPAHHFEHKPSFKDIGFERKLRRFPYVPNRIEQLDQDCYEAFNIQVQGLARRFQATSGKHLVIGVSGGLDSTHALIVAAKVCDYLEIPRTTILGYTMPGFATGESTKSNAWALMKALGIVGEEIDIKPAARQMLSDMRHPFAKGEAVYDVTFENVQAGLRTDYLFRLANHNGGFVVGTGDLSELALGWCTYGVGDQMSHYGVNAGRSKTLIQYLIRWVVKTGQFDAETNRILDAILETKISPELVPADEAGMQSTEDRIGPYELHDFFLFHILRSGQPPSKVAFLAWQAWHDARRACGRSTSRSS
jgi:NAD+ synthase (glutamine-hydrolysing)